MKNNPELRINELTGEVVVFSSQRAQRPYTVNSSDEFCPFCPKNQGMTPAPSFKSADGRIKIFENMYPIFNRESISAYGCHDVLVDTDLHGEGLDQFKEEDIFQILIALYNRLEYLYKNEKIKYVQIFKNEGAKAGASIEHSHWQIASASYIPVKQKTIAYNANKYFNEYSECYTCALLKRAKDYIFYENESFVALCPPYSKYSYEINITSKRHCADFLGYSKTELQNLADALKVSLSVLKKTAKEFNYNLCLYNTVINDASFDYSKILHFNLQILLHSSNMAGFELSTDSWINSVYPEEAAEKFRNFLKK